MKTRAVGWNAAVSSGPIEILNEISTFLVRETNSLWRTSSGRRRYSGWPRFVMAKTLSGETFPRSLPLVPFVHRAAAGYFRGFYSGTRVSIWPLCNSPGAMKHTRASSREKSIFTSTIKSVHRRACKTLNRKLARGRIHDRDVRSGVKTTEGRRGREEGYFSVYFALFVESLVKMAAPPRKKIDSGKAASLFPG